jgi:hypothetical protein
VAYCRFRIAVAHLCDDIARLEMLDKAGSPIAFYRLIPVALSKSFADAMIPAAGVGGNLLLVRRLYARVFHGGPQSLRFFCLWSAITPHLHCWLSSCFFCLASWQGNAPAGGGGDGFSSDCAGNPKSCLMAAATWQPSVVAVSRTASRCEQPPIRCRRGPQQA